VSQRSFPFPLRTKSLTRRVSSFLPPASTTPRSNTTSPPASGPPSGILQSPSSDLDGSRRPTYLSTPSRSSFDLARFFLSVPSTSRRPITPTLRISSFEPTVSRRDSKSRSFSLLEREPESLRRFSFLSEEMERREEGRED